MKDNKKMTNFWHGLPRPFFIMAPMANVTDAVFRKIIAKYSRMGKKGGGPDAMWTEFVSADGLVSAGGKRLLIDLKYSEAERPIVAQLFTGHTEAMKKAAALVRNLKFDGLDINMGCPDRSVEKQGGGAALIKDPKMAIEVIRAAREGVRSRKQGDLEIPVSVKTRLGYNKVDLEWIRTLLEQRLPALTVHLRTRKEMSDVPAHWELMPDIVKMRDEMQADLPKQLRTIIIGNGDSETLEDAETKVKKYGCDGVMIGRGIFGKPWLFDKIKKPKSTPYTLNATPSLQERLEIMLEHAKLFEKTYCGKKRIKNFAVMKKHFKAYVSGWDGAKELRVKLMGTENATQVAKIIGL